MNYKELISTGMSENRETLLDIVDSTLTDDEMSADIPEIKDIKEIPCFTVWSNNYVYFLNINVKYIMKVVSVPRNPNGVRVSPVDLQ